MDRPRCPDCMSPDVARYRWPDDEQSQVLKKDYPNAQVCLDCKHVWFPQEAE